MDPVLKIKHTLDALFGSGVSRQLPKDIDFKFSKKNGRIRYVYQNTNLLCTLRTDGGIAITLYFAKILLKSKKFLENCVVIDSESKPFVEKGKSVFCGHIKKCGKNVMIGSDVAILYKNSVIAVGKSVLSYDMIKSQTRGVAIKVRDSLKSQTE